LRRQLPGQQQALLSDISFSVRGGDRVALVGPSGSGKSLLCRALAQLDPYEGEVLWRGEPIADSGIPLFRSEVTYVSQRPSLLEDTIRENLRGVFDLAIHRQRGQAWREDRIVALLQRFDFDREFLEKTSRELSGGESQVVSLLRAVQLDPTFLLLDEPTSAMDARRALVAEAVVADWQAAAPTERAYLWITHNEGQAQRIGQRTLHVQSGRVSELPPHTLD
jgi:putative ABC transport system ATP-binding protein